MTDKQLDELEAVVRETGHMTKLEALTVLADNRRLRKLEQAVRGIMRKRGGMWLLFPGSVPGMEQGWSYSNDAIATIGRLLEGEE